MSETFDFCRKKISSLSRKLADINRKRIDALRYYISDASVIPFEENRSRVVSNDIMDTIEWAMPALLEVFCGQDKPIAIEPSEGTDVDTAEILDVLVSYQLQVRNNWYEICNDWFKDALLMKLGILKYQWNKKTEKIMKSYQDLTEDEYRALASKENVKILSEQERIIQDELLDPLSGDIIRPRLTNYDVEVEHIIEDEYPSIVVVPPEDFGINPNVKDVESADFVYQRIYMPKWQAKETYAYSTVNWDDLRTGQYFEEDTGLNLALKEIKDISLGVGNFNLEEFKDYLIIYECYYRDTKTGEPKITIICDNTIIYEGRNEYNQPPFVAITPIKLSHKVMGLSMADIIVDLQRLRSLLMRQIVDNLYQSNFRRYFVDPERVNMDDYLDLNVTNAAIRTKGNPKDAVMPEIKAPLPPETFMFWETLQLERDYHSGVPRSYQGVVASIQHRTARGQSQQVQLASQRIQSLARLIAEMGIRKLINAIIDMNIRFLTKKTSIRYLNKWINIDPDNIIGKFDVKVSVGIGTPDRENTIIQCQQLLAIYGQLFKAGIGVVNAQNVYNTIAKMLNAMNIKNVADFITNPNVVEGLSQIYQMILPIIIRTQPGLLEPINQIFAAAGVPVEQFQQAIAQAMTAEQIGSEAPRQATQPAQPIAPRVTPPGGGFYP